MRGARGSGVFTAALASLLVIVLALGTADELLHLFIEWAWTNLLADELGGMAVLPMLALLR